MEAAGFFFDRTFVVAIDRAPSTRHDRKVKLLGVAVLHCIPWDLENTKKMS